MKKETAFLTVIIMMFSLAGCNGSQDGSHSPIAAWFEKDIPKIKIVHYTGGSTVEWTVENEQADLLRNWASELECELLAFEEGQSPGDSDGGEVYTFSPAEDGHPDFSYVINGTDNCYLSADGNWYSVSNPSNPPLTEPKGEKLTLEKIKELAKIGEALSWSDFGQYDHEDIGSGLYIYRYDIDEHYILLIGGGNTRTAPEYIRLVLKADNSEFIDIRTENIDAFINSQMGKDSNTSSPLSGVTMMVTKSSDTSVTVRITNETDKDIQCGEDFCLKVLDEETGNWREPDTVIDNAAFKALAYMIPKNSPLEMDISLEWLYGKLEPGRYRIEKNISDFRGTGDHTDYTFTAEFNIED